MVSWGSDCLGYCTARVLGALLLCGPLGLVAGCAGGPAGPAAAKADGIEAAVPPAAAADPSQISISPAVAPAGSAAPAALKSGTFSVHHALTVKDIPPGAKAVRVWFWLPEDDECQKVLDFTVADAPPGFQVTQADGDGNRFLYAEVADPTGPVSIQTDFLIRRCAVSVPVDPSKAGPLTDLHRKLFAEYLRTDVPHMRVTADYRKLANEICGDERNVVAQAGRLGRWVVDHSDHYSIPGAPKSSGQGDADYCLTKKGGGCTDQHALFIALARARGIPTRLHFGTLLKPQNEGKDMDPGYRCWVLYFVPRYGWVPMDLSAADTNPDRREFYCAGLDERRVRFSEGRDLTPAQAGPRVDLMIIAYVEVDGRPHKGFDRVLRYTEVRDGAAQPIGPTPAVGSSKAPVSDQG